MRTALDFVSWLVSREGVFPRLRPFTPVEEKCPLHMVMPDRATTMTRGGVMTRIVEVTGRDYSGLEPSHQAGLFLGRKAFFEGLPSTIMVFQQSHRFKMRRDAGKEQFALPMAQEIADRWAANFTESFRTRHYLIFTTSVDTLTDQLAVMAQKTEGSANDELYRILVEATNTALLRLKDYRARLLEGDEVSSYWAQLLNGRPTPQKLPADGLLDGLLSGTDLEFPAAKPYQVYSGAKQRYSGWLYVKMPATATDAGLLDGVFKLRHELSMFQTFAAVDKQSALSDVEDRRKNTLSFTKASEIIMLELGELAQRIQADEIVMMRHRWAVEVFGDSPEELEKAIADVRNAIETWGYRVARERANREAQFWSRFPEMHTFNSRKRSLTSENAAHLASFATVGEGLDTCSWGNAPVTTFKTLSGSEFGFTFHSEPGEKKPGHTLVLGGTNSGKTTFISFLLSQCFKYPDFRLLAFDRLHGLEVATLLHDGEYIDVVDGVGINPLQLPDTPETRAFLDSWFQVLTGRTDDDALDNFGHAIEQAFELDKDKRSLPNVADAFGLNRSGSVRRTLNRWLEGPLSHFFTADRDSLDFRKPWVTIDMTTLLDLPDVLAPLTHYLFHKLLVTAREKGGYAAFVDELPKYLASPVFAPKIELLLQEVRKTDGVFIGAAQSADSILNSPAVEKFLNNIETYVFFPEPRANPAHYRERLMLNEQEFHWLTQSAKPREVLVKRKSGESTVINVDLLPLGKYLKAFDSSIDAVSHAKQLRQEYGDAWKSVFLGN